MVIPDDPGSHWNARARQAGVVTHDLVLPDEQFAKAVVYMRALRGAVIAFWYATIEDVEAASIEAAQACFVVNVPLSRPHAMGIYRDTLIPGAAHAVRSLPVQAGF